MIRIGSPFIILVCFIAFFPWVSLGFLNFGSDIQIYSTLLCISILPFVLLSCFLKKDGFVFTKDRLFYGMVLFFLGSFLTILSILIVDGVNIDSLRGIFPYLTAIIWSIFVSCIAKQHSKNIQKILPLAFLIWFFVGVVQFLYDRDFLVSFLNRTVITDDRGVISLGSEPSYFAMVTLCFIILFNIYNKKNLALLSIVTLFFLTRSSAVIFPFVVCLSLFWIVPFLRSTTKNNFKFLFFIIVVFVLLFILIFLFLIYDSDSMSGVGEASRISKLIHMFATLDFSGLIMDGSFNIRLTHYAGSIYYFFSDIGIPHGTLSWPEKITEFSHNHPVFWDTGLNQTTRINSGLGTVLFEGGVFGCMIFWGLYWIISAYEVNRIKKLFILFMLFVFFLTVYSIKIPFLYVTIMLYCMNRKSLILEKQKMKNKQSTMSFG